jgi:hypothetical protein
VLGTRASSAWLDPKQVAEQFPISIRWVGMAHSGSNAPINTKLTNFVRLS